MQSNFEKYLRILGLLLSGVIVFVVLLTLLIIGSRALFGILEPLGWTAIIFRLIVVAFPSALFITAYLIFLNRTRQHKTKWVRLASYILFIAGVLTWIYTLVSDMQILFNKPGNSVENFGSYEVSFVAAHILCFLIIGILQAATAEKEIDWMERGRS